jgi:hypothetical protein
MVKETKSFRKQAAKAERMAQAASDPEISQRLLTMARAYRSQADVLKAKKKSGKKRRPAPSRPDGGFPTGRLAPGDGWSSWRRCAFSECRPFLMFFKSTPERKGNLLIPSPPLFGFYR